jgi:hypothetical protein
VGVRPLAPSILLLVLIGRASSFLPLSPSPESRLHAQRLWLEAPRGPQGRGTSVVRMATTVTVRR